MKKHNFKELKVWKLGMEVSDTIYKLTKKFPKEEIFGLALQMRKAAVSIPSNIAEGCGRGTDAQLIHFLSIAQGSTYELETQLIIAQMQEYVPNSEFETIADKLSELERMIEGFRNKLEAGLI